MPCTVEETMDESGLVVKGEIPVSVQSSNSTLKFINYNSDWKRLKTAVAWVLKACKAIIELSKKRKHLLSDSFIDVHNINQDMIKARVPIRQSLSVEEAENAIVQFCQWEWFHSDVCTSHWNLCKQKSFYL